MQCWSGKEALQQQEDGWCVAGGELIKVIDGECGDGAMIGLMLEVS